MNRKNSKASNSANHSQ